MADLKAQTAAIEAGFVHGAVLLHKLAAQVHVLQRVELAAHVVIEQLLGQMQKSPQLTESVAISLHLRGIVLRPEEGAVAVRGDISALVNYVKKTRLQDLKDRKSIRSLDANESSISLSISTHKHFLFSDKTPLSLFLFLLLSLEVGVSKASPR